MNPSQDVYYLPTNPVITWESHMPNSMARWHVPLLAPGDSISCNNAPDQNFFLYKLLPSPQPNGKRIHQPLLSAER